MGKITPKQNKKGQITLSFNWIFVLIAGTVILLFFVGLILKQKSSSELKLNFDVVNILDSILVASTVSEQTINAIDTSGISSRELFFECELDDGGGFIDIFARYGIKGTSASEEIPSQVIMSPSTIQTKQLITWSLPYEMPFKVIDILIVTGQSNQYYVFGDSQGGLKSELQNTTSSLNIDFIDSTSQITPIGANKHVRIIDLDGSYVAQGAPVPIVLQDAPDQKVDAIVLKLGGYDHYQKQGTSFNKINREGQIPIISTFQSDRDAAQISAMFAQNKENYQCNMVKVFKRMHLLTQIYQGKAQQLKNFYDPSISPETSDTECLILIDDEFSTEDLMGTLQTMNSQLTSCITRGYEECIDMQTYAQRLASINANLDNAGCTTLY